MPHRKSKHGMQMGRGMVYRDTEGDQFGGGQEPEYLQPRIPQHSHLDVCFSSHPSGVPRPSGPAERGHRVGGLLPAVLTGQSSPGMYCAWAQCRARQDRVEAAAQKNHAM